MQPVSANAEAEKVRERDRRRDDSNMIGRRWGAGGGVPGFRSTRRLLGWWQGGGRCDNRFGRA